MPKAVTFSVDTREFQSALKKLYEYSKRTPADFCNKHAFYIARGATRLTPKADKASIATTLGESVITFQNNAKGRTVKGRGFRLVAGSGGSPLAAMIINKRQREKGLPGLYGKEMEKAVKAMIGARIRSVAFLKSGWLPAIRALAKIVKGASSFAGVKTYGQPKGSAEPATVGWRAICKIINSAGENKNNKGALHKYGAPALEQAVRDETASMNKRLEEIVKEAADKAGVKHG